jgi:hypothetical protein
LNYPSAKWQGTKKEASFVHRILCFDFFSISYFVHGFEGCHFQCDRSNSSVKSLIFSRNNISSMVLEFDSRPGQQKKFILTNTYKSKGEILAIYAQLDLKELYKITQLKGRLPNCHEFWHEEVH